jgi:hypothetical protein
MARSTARSAERSWYVWSQKPEYGWNSAIYAAFLIWYFGLVTKTAKSRSRRHQFKLIQTGGIDDRPTPICGFVNSRQRKLLTIRAKNFIQARIR